MTFSGFHFRMLNPVYLQHEEALKQHSAAFLPEPQEHDSFFPQHAPYFFPDPQGHDAFSFAFLV